MHVRKLPTTGTAILGGSNGFMMIIPPKEVLFSIIMINFAVVIDDFAFPG